MSNYDVIVIGGGPGGYIAAERLGQAGKKVLLAEAVSLGGTCLNVGCIPTKTLLNSAKLYDHALHGESYGVSAREVTFDWQKIQAWKNEVVTKLCAGVAAMEKKSGVEVVNEWAQLVAPGRVRVGDTEHTATDVIIATGSVPVMPPIPGAKDNPRVVDSTGALSLPEVPARLAVIGGGVIGVEFASLYKSLGTEVTVIEMAPEIAPFMDADIAGKLRGALEGIKFELGCRVTGINDGVVTYLDGEETKTVEADVILMAVGRKAAVEGWGAKEANLDVGRAGVVVDETMKTNLPGVWAVGDVTGRSLLAHAAYRMGEIAAANILDAAAKTRGQVMRYNTVPWAVYTQPEAAGVGLTEVAAKEAGYSVATATVPGYMAGRYAAENGFRAPGAAKLIACRETGKVLGVHVLSTYAAEMIWGAATALEMELTVEDLRQVIFPHPTVSELIREAAWAIKL